MSNKDSFWFVPLVLGIFAFGFLNSDFVLIRAMAAALITAVFVCRSVLLRLGRRAADDPGTKINIYETGRGYLFWFVPLALGILTFGVLMPGFLQLATMTLMLMTGASVIAGFFFLWKDMAVAYNSRTKNSGVGKK